MVDGEGRSGILQESRPQVSEEIAYILDNVIAVMYEERDSIIEEANDKFANKDTLEYERRLFAAEKISRLIEKIRASL